MAQALPAYCPRCGAPTVGGQRFCVNCGLLLAAAPSQIDTIPQVQPAKPFAQTAQQAPQQYPRSPERRNIPPTSFPQPPQKRRSGRAGFVFISLLLLIVIAAGLYLSTGSSFHLPAFGSGTGNSGAQPPVTTTPLHVALTYAGVDLTILAAQQSQSFVDDPYTTSTGMLRLNIQEQNKTSLKVSWLYSAIARLIVPAKKTVAPTFVQARVGIAPGATQKSLIDFAVPLSTRISQLTLRLGAVNEAQMDIPLTGHADLSKYASKTVRPNEQMTYLGLNWTLVSATSSLSIAGQQASKGMSYIVLALKVDNTLSQEAIPGSAFDYVRLKSGSTTASPKYTTLPVSFDTGESGKTGTVTFLMPQSNTIFTLILLPQGGTDKATTDFQFA